MKKKYIFATTLIIIILIPVCAQKQKQSRYIKKYDVLQYLPNKSDGNPATFWKLIIDNNKEFKGTMAKFDNPKGSAKQAKEKIDKAVANMKSYREMRESTPADEELNKGVQKMMFGDGDNYGMTFSVSTNKEWNAFCTPDGHVLVNIGLIEVLKKDPDMLYGVVAHEICHYIYRHVLIHEYKSIKKEKQNMIGAAIGAAGTAIGNAAAASAGEQGEYGAEQYTSWYDTAREQSEMAKYKYSREEEAEADIVAYRFLEWIGVDPEKYIEAHEKINLDYLRGTDDKESDHPSTKFRIEMLKQLTPAPWNKQ